MNLYQLSPKLIHDAANEMFRSPIGALPSGARLRLFLQDEEGEARAARCFFSRDGWEENLKMIPAPGGFLLAWEAPEPAAYTYCFLLELAEGALWLCAGPGGRFGQLMSSRGEGFRLTVYDPDFETPAWFRRSVMYQIFPDRFARDDSGTAQRGIDYHRYLGRNVKYHDGWDEPVDWQPNSADGFYFPLDFYGGTLRGIEERLPELKALGVGALYLNPVFEACSNHRYDTADYLKIDPILGTNEDFSRLSREAEKLGIRILLDGVFSHTGADSVYFNKFSHYDAPGAYNAGEASPYYKWYDFRAFPQSYRCWWNFEDLPEVDENDPAWQDFVITGENSVVKTWLRNGAAGFRLDVADELPDDVLALIRQAAKAVSPENVVLGEVWEDAVTKTSYGTKRKYALGASLDSVMNYPLRTAILDFFCFRSDARALADVLLGQRLNYPPPFYWSLMNLLSSHDVERVRTALAARLDARGLSREQQAGLVISEAQDRRGAAMQRLAAAVQFALPGVPCIYYGDETGMNGMLDPFDRAPYAEGRFPLRDWYARLGDIRNADPALSTGAAAFSAPDRDVLAIVRLISGGADRFGEAAADGAFLILVNRADTPRSVVADLWLSNAGFTARELSAMKALDHSRGLCRLTDEAIKIEGGLAHAELPPESARIFKLT